MPPTGAFRLLARAYAHNKQCITIDGGWCYDPFGKYTPTAYTASAIIQTIRKYAGTNDCLMVLEENPINELAEANDTIYVTGTSSFNGEHTVTGNDSNDHKRVLFTDTHNAAAGGSDIVETEGWIYFAPTSKGTIMVDPLRVISHPGFSQVEGQGIYTYPCNPDITRNFIYHPVAKLDGIVQRTLSSNVFIMRPQVDEDIVITEIWLGGGGNLSTFSQMARAFHQYWTTMPGIGEVLGWEPRDQTSDRFGIQIVRVQLGGLDFEYKEVREHMTQHQGSMLDRQLTLQFKLAKTVVPPKPMVTLIGR